MTGQQQREILLTNAPFSDMLSLVTHFNEEIKKDRKTSQFIELRKVITEGIIPHITYNSANSIEQGIVLAGCQDKDIVKLLHAQLLNQIESNRLNFPELYSALTECINKASDSSLSDDDKLQITQALVERMDTIHAPDIQLTCYMLYTLYAVLYKMVQDGMEHVYDKQKAKIEHALQSLKNRLQAVQATNEDEKELLANIHEAIKFSEHVLVKLKDHRTNTRRCLHRIKIAGLLLLQAAEVGAQWYGAVGSFGVGAPSALGSTYSFMSNLIRHGKRVYRHFHHNKGYFSALIHWRKSLETMLVANRFDEAQKFLYVMTSSGRLPEYWDNPHFILGAIKILLVTAEIYPDIQNCIIGILNHYYYNNKSNKDDLFYQITQQAAFSLLKLLDESTNLSPILKAQLQATVTSMSEKDKTLYLNYRKSQQISISASQHNLAKEIWQSYFEADVKLYEICLSIIKQESKELTSDQIAYISTLNSLVSSEKLSNWGKELLSTFANGELQVTAKVAARIVASISQSIVGNEMNLTIEDIKFFAYDKAMREMLMEMIRVGIQEGTANVGNIKISDEQKARWRENFDHFVDKVFSVNPETTVELRYYNDVVGNRVMAMRSDNKNTNNVIPDNSTKETASMTIS